MHRLKCSRQIIKRQRVDGKGDPNPIGGDDENLHGIPFIPESWGGTIMIFSTDDKPDFPGYYHGEKAIYTKIADISA